MENKDDNRQTNTLEPTHYHTRIQLSCRKAKIFTSSERPLLIYFKPSSVAEDDLDVLDGTAILLEWDRNYNCTLASVLCR